MKKHPYLKICRVFDLDTAKRLVECGIRFIGFHVIDYKDLHLLEKYNKIDTYLKNQYNFDGAVLVTKIDDYTILKENIFQSSFSNIQLHYQIGDELFDIINKIRNNKTLFCVYDPKMKNNTYLKSLVDFADYVILDNIEGGLGKTIKIENEINMSSSKFFIAGGVNIYNIKELYRTFKPFGFDIQSSCEIAKGIKDFEYIQKLLNISNYELESDI